MKIILATDGTIYSDAAAETLCRFALGPDDDVLIVSVIDMALPMAVDIYGGFLPDTTTIEQTARENAQKYVERTAKMTSDAFPDKNPTITSEVLFGSPDSRLVETAEKFGADLIVVGSHGYRRWERILLGSVSNSVVHHAPCSVLVVRSAGTEESDEPAA